MLVGRLGSPHLALFAAHGLGLGTTVVGAIAGHVFGSHLFAFEVVDVTAFDPLALGVVLGDVGFFLVRCEGPLLGGGADVGKCSPPGDCKLLGLARGVLDPHDVVVVMIPLNCESPTAVRTLPIVRVARAIRVKFFIDPCYDLFSREWWDPAVHGAVGRTVLCVCGAQHLLFFLAVVSG